MTWSPRWGPGGMWICSLSGARSARLGLGLQLLVGGEPGLALGLAGLGRHAHPLELALEGALAGRVGLLLLLEAGPLLLQPAGVVALERVAAAAVELEDPARHVVEEVAVVGDGDDRAVVVAQEALEPRHRLGVEVVGGLVEQQQVGAGQQQPAQRHPAALAARERGDLGVAGREPQGVHGDLDGALQVPGAGGLDLRLEVGLAGAELLVVGVGVGPAGHDLVVFGEQRRHLADAVHHVALDVLGGVELRLLLEHAHREPGSQPGLAGVAVVDARHDPQQRRLAGPVGPEHADLGARVEGQGDVLQHLLVGRVEPAHLAHREDELRAHGARRRYRLGRSGPNRGQAARMDWIWSRCTTTSSSSTTNQALSFTQDSSRPRQRVAAVWTITSMPSKGRSAWGDRGRRSTATLGRMLTSCTGGCSRVYTCWFVAGWIPG